MFVFSNLKMLHGRNHQGSNFIRTSSDFNIPPSHLLSIFALPSSTVTKQYNKCAVEACTVPHLALLLQRSAYMSTWGVLVALIGIVASEPEGIAVDVLFYSQLSHIQQTTYFQMY